MLLKEITNRVEWENFQSRQPLPQFTQSWAWGEFRASMGCPVKRLALEDGCGNWLAGIQTEYRKKSLGLGYWFAPRGPVISSAAPSSDHRHIITELIKKIDAGKVLSRSLFWRWEPPLQTQSEERILPARFWSMPTLNPADIRLIDLTKPQDVLLAAMHQKTRYNIRVAEKHGVKVRITNHPADLDRFLRLVEETSTRDKIVQHNSAYIAKAYHVLAAGGQARLRVAELNGAMLAGSFEVVYGNTVTYLYGASSNLMRQAMAPFSLHWSAITEAQNQGYHWYDLGGLNPPLSSSPRYKKSWEGVTRFKLGWGGEHRQFVGTWDLPMNLVLYRLLMWRHIYFTKH